MRPGPQQAEPWWAAEPRVRGVGRQAWYRSRRGIHWLRGDGRKMAPGLRGYAPWVLSESERRGWLPLQTTGLLQRYQPLRHRGHRVAFPRKLSNRVLSDARYPNSVLHQGERQSKKPTSTSSCQRRPRASRKSRSNLRNLPDTKTTRPN
jgi:hypothetical protein